MRVFPQTAAFFHCLQLPLSASLPPARQRCEAPALQVPCGECSRPMPGLSVYPPSHACPGASNPSLAPVRSHLPCAAPHPWHPSSVCTDWPDCEHSPRQAHRHCSCASGRLGGASATCASLATHARPDRLQDRPGLPARSLDINSKPFGSQVPRISCVSCCNYSSYTTSYS